MSKTYSKIVGLELENFMAIESAKLVFDETNIINLKGYNDSGKSAIVRSLGVLLYNAHQRAQKNWIKHGAQYFRIKLHFDDGITIVRDKYLHGASLYEMYENGNLLFSTRVGSTLTQVKEVPLEIREYLAMTETSAGSYLNSQSIYDKQFLIQTSGSENVELLNGVLQLKETGIATTAIKNDINALNSSINGLIADIEAIKVSLQRYDGLDEGFLTLLSEYDSKYEEVEKVFNDYSHLLDLLVERSKLVDDLPTLDVIDYSELQSLQSVLDSIIKVQNIVDVPSLPVIEQQSYLDLLKIRELQNSYENHKGITFEVPIVDFSELNSLKNLYNEFQNFSEISGLCSSLAEEEDKVKLATAKIEAYAQENGIAISKCDNCGALVQGVAGHVHV